MTAVAILDRGMAELISRECPEALPYALRLATNADAAGNVIDARLRAATALGRSERTVSRWRAALQRVGFLIRYSGGHKGECVRMVIKRFVHDSSAFVARRAMAACWLSTKDRIASMAERKRTGRAKGDMNVTRLTSSRETSAISALSSVSKHHFAPDDSASSCLMCQLPRQNAHHVTL
jgi:hypothetical protein